MVALLSDATVQLQNEWMAQLGGTAAELQSVADDARRHHEACRTALQRMGELYAFCGRLVVKANQPSLASAHTVDSASDARRVSAQLRLSMMQWRDAADQIAVKDFFEAERDHWKEVDAEVRRAFSHHKQRQQQCGALTELQKSLKRAEKANNTAAAIQVKAQVAEVEAGRRYEDAKVQRNIAERAKRCSRDLIQRGTTFLDLLSRYGQTCAICFQPIDGTAVRRHGEGERGSASRTSNTTAASQSGAAETVVGVVLERPALPFDAQDESSIYAHSFVYQRESTAGSPTRVTEASSVHRDPSTV